MTTPILTIDFGTSTSSAVLVLPDGRHRPVRDPVTSSFIWPSAVFRDGDRLLVGAAAERRKQSAPDRYRTGFKRVFGDGHTIELGGRSFEVVDLVAEVLRQIRDAAGSPSRPVSHAVLTVPSSYGIDDTRRALMVEAGLRAGFTDVELLYEPVAAALSPIADGPFADGATVLVYDLGGGTFDAALVRFEGGGHRVLGHAAEEHIGGRDIDTLLLKYAVKHASQELATELDPPVTKGADELGALRGRLLAEDMLRELKHGLSGDETGEGYLTARLPPVAISRVELTKLVDKTIATTLACCRRMLSAAGVDPTELTAVLAVGGSSRLYAVTLALPGLCPTVRAPEDVDLAVVQGAAAWAGKVDGRRLAPVAPGADERALRWTLPFGDAARLTRWMVRAGEIYGADAPLGVVRLDDGSLWQLRDGAGSSALLRHVQASPGDQIFSGDWLVTVANSAPEYEIVPTVGRVTDVRFVEDVVWGLAGGTMASWSPGDPTVIGEVWDHSLRLVRTAGDVHPPYYARTASGELLVWDADNGEELGRVPIDNPVVMVAIAPGIDHMAAVVGAQVRVWVGGADDPLYTIEQAGIDAAVFSPDGDTIAGTGSGPAVVLWDVGSGAERRRLTPAGAAVFWTRFPSYGPDGTRLAVACSDRTVRIWDTTSGTELFSGPHPADVQGVAYSPDGQHLLTVCADGIARTWDVVNGVESVRLPHARRIVTGAYDEDGRRVVTVTDDGIMRIWRPSCGS